jgi:hypothetical protein
MKPSSLLICCYESRGGERLPIFHFDYVVLLISPVITGPVPSYDTVHMTMDYDDANFVCKKKYIHYTHPLPES